MADNINVSERNTLPVLYNINVSTVILPPRQHYIYISIYISISIYIFESVCLFVCLFAVNAKTTERIDSKRSGITKNDPESVLYGLKSPVLVLSGRYDISGFPFAAARHFYFHFRLLRRCLAIKTASTARHVAREPSHLERKCYCLFFTMYCVPIMLFILRHYIKDLLQLPNSLSST